MIGESIVKENKEEKHLSLSGSGENSQEKE